MSTFHNACGLAILLSARLLLAGSTSGYVIGWGSNVSGEAVGIPSYPFSNGVVVVTHNPFATGTVTIAGQVLSNATMIAAGMSHSLALLNDGTLIGWGGNIVSQAVGYATPFPHRAAAHVRIGSETLSNVTAIAAGRSQSMALKRDGTVVAWGENQHGQTTVPAGLTNVMAISAGAFHGLALRRDGTVVSWGTPSATPPPLSNVVAIAAGHEYGPDLALIKDGTAVEWGWGALTDQPIFAGVTNVIAIASGSGHRLALRLDSTVFGWGVNTDGQATGVPTKHHPSESGFSSGSVNLSGQMLSNVAAIAVASQYSLALKKDGTVVAWGNKTSYRDVPAGLSNVVAIAAGENFCLAITTNSAVASRFRR